MPLHVNCGYWVCVSPRFLPLVQKDGDERCRWWRWRPARAPPPRSDPPLHRLWAAGRYRQNITGSEYGLAEYNICKKNTTMLSLGLYEEQKLYLKQFVFNGLSAAHSFVKALAWVIQQNKRVYYLICKCLNRAFEVEVLQNCFTFTCIKLSLHKSHM